MTVTNLARVIIHQIRVDDAHSVAGEPGSFAEWNLVFAVNGQLAFWRQDVPLSAGLIGPGSNIYPLSMNFVVPLLNGQVSIRISGDEIDDWPNPDDKIEAMEVLRTPAEEFPLGAVWQSASVSDLLGANGTTGWSPYPRDTETIGGYTIWYSITPVAADGWDDTRQYIPLFREGWLDGNGWSVNDWTGFTKNHDDWIAQGLRLRRVSTCLSDANQPRFADTNSRTFMGIYSAGSGPWQFWLMDEHNFTNKYNDLSKQKIRCDDIFCYRENGQTMLGGTFSGDGEPTELVLLPGEKFEVDWRQRRDNRQRLVSIDTFHDGKMRWYVGLYESGDYDQLISLRDTWKDLIDRKGGLREKGLRIEDYAAYNEGGELLLCAIWNSLPKDSGQDWIMQEDSFSNLESRIDFNWSLGRHIQGLDSWAKDDPE